MKNLFLLPILLCLSIVLTAQKDIPLKGVVVEQNSKFKTGKVKYLPNVKITSSPKAGNTCYSNSNGKFTLVYVDKPYGNTARIYAKKDEYEIVNKKVLEKAAVLGRTTPLRIVVCHQDQLYENQIAYYEIAHDAVLATHKKREAILKKEGIEQEQLLATMEIEAGQKIKSLEQARELLLKQLQASQEQAQKLAHEFAVINLDDQSSTYQQAFKAFLEKDIDRALTILNEVNLEERLKTNTENIANLDSLKVKNEQKIQQDVEQCVLKAKLYILKYQFEKADSMYSLAVKYAPDDDELIFEYAKFLEQQNNLNKAESLYKKVLEKYRALAIKNPTTFLPNVAKTLNNLGGIHFTKKEFSKAEGEYTEALNIYREFAEDNSNVLTDVATTLHGLGNLHCAKNEFSKAESEYTEALNIYRQFTEDNSNVFLSYVAREHYSLATLHFTKNEFSKAEGEYTEALNIYRQFAKDNPNAFLPHVAITLHSLAALHYTKNELSKAEGEYTEALNIRRQLAKNNPKAFLTNVAETLNNLAILHDVKKEFSKAEAEYTEALNIYRQFAKDNPNAFLADVATTLCNLGGVHYTKNELSKAEAEYTEALNIQRQLAKDNPKAFLANIAQTLNNLGALHHTKNEFSKAEVEYTEALSIRRQLAKDNPKVFSAYIAETLINFGTLHQAKNELSKAEAKYTEALNIRRQLAEENPKAFLAEVASVLNNLGALHRTKNELSKAEGEYTEALNIRRQFAEENPKIYNLDVALTAINLGILYREILQKTGDMSLKTKGLTLMKEVKSRFGTYPSNHPTVMKYTEYVNSLTEFFSVYTEKDFLSNKILKEISVLAEKNKLEKDINQQVIRQKKIINKYIELQKIIPNNPNVRIVIATEYGRLTWFQIITKQFKDSEQSARKGLEIAPEHERIPGDLALSLLYQGKYEEAKAICLKIKDKPLNDITHGVMLLEKINALEKEGITHPDVEKIRALLK